MPDGGPLDLEPSFNPETGLPHSFMETPLDVHLRLWTEGPRAWSRRAATPPCSSRCTAGGSTRGGTSTGWHAEDAEAVSAFLADQLAFQAELEQALRP